MKYSLIIAFYIVSTIGHAQENFTYCLGQIFSSRCYHFTKKSNETDKGTFEMYQEIDDGQSSKAKGTYTETIDQIIIDPFYIIDYYNGVKTGDSLFIKKKTIFYKEKNKLIEYDENDKKWKENSDNFYIKAKK